QADWQAWNQRSLADEPIVRLILDGTVVRVRLDKKATSISLLVVIGIREDGQKVLLAVRNMGGETTAAWRAVLDDLVARQLRRPAFVIVDGAPGLEQALAAVWNGVPLQRCTVHKHRNLLAHAPKRLSDEITADYTDMIYATTVEEIAERRQAFLRKWRLRHRAVADSLEEAGDALFAFTKLPPSQWKSARTTNAIERLHEEFKRRIKTQTVLPSAATAAMPWPRKTSTCRSFVTISSGLCRLFAIVVLLHGQNHTSRWTRSMGVDHYPKPGGEMRWGQPLTKSFQYL